MNSTSSMTHNKLHFTTTQSQSNETDEYTYPEVLYESNPHLNYKSSIWRRKQRKKELGALVTASVYDEPPTYEY